MRNGDLVELKNGVTKCKLLLLSLEVGRAGNGGLIKATTVWAFVCQFAFSFFFSI